jgi:hypothetical protein
MSGIDKREIATVGKAMEVRRVVEHLLKMVGFIPSCDHGVPPVYPSKTLLNIRDYWQS